MDKDLVDALMEQMAGVSTWDWVIHPSVGNPKQAAYDAELIGQQVQVFVFRRIMDAWEDGERPHTVRLTARIEVS